MHLTAKIGALLRTVWYFHVGEFRFQKWEISGSIYKPWVSKLHLRFGSWRERYLQVGSSYFPYFPYDVKAEWDEEEERGGGGGWYPTAVPLCYDGDESKQACHSLFVSVSFTISSCSDQPLNCLDGTQSHSNCTCQLQCPPLDDYRSITDSGCVQCITERNTNGG